jgi:hypothetical protein
MRCQISSSNNVPFPEDYEEPAERTVEVQGQAILGPSSALHPVLCDVVGRLRCRERRGLSALEDQREGIHVLEYDRRHASDEFTDGRIEYNTRCTAFQNRVVTIPSQKCFNCLRFGRCRQRTY